MLFFIRTYKHYSLLWVELDYSPFWIPFTHLTDVFSADEKDTVIVQVNLVLYIIEDDQFV